MPDGARKKRPPNTDLDGSWYQTPEFLALRDEWYRKLEEDDFEDQELVVPGVHMDSPLLKYTAGLDELRMRRAAANGNEEYFRVAGQYLEEGLGNAGDANRRRLERSIWKMHAEGMNIPEIQEERKKTWAKRLSRPQIKRIINRVRDRMVKELAKKKG